MKGLKNYLCISYKTFSTRTSVHGFSELYTSKSSAAKLFWLISLVICLSVTTYQLSKAVQQYVNEPYLTVIEKIAEDEMKYPDIFLCYEHWIYWADFRKALNLNFTKESVLYGLSYLTDIYAETLFDVSEAKQQFELTMASNNFTKMSQFYYAIAKSSPNEYFNEIHLFSDSLCYKAKSENLIALMNPINKRSKIRVVLHFNEGTVEPYEDGFVTHSEHVCYIGRFLFLNKYPIKLERFSLDTLKTNVDDFQLPTYLVLADIIEIRPDDVSVHFYLHATVSKWRDVRKMNCDNDKISVNSDNTCQDRCRENYRHKTCSCLFLQETLLAGLDNYRTLCRNRIWFFNASNSCINLTLVERKRIPTNAPLNCTTDDELCCIESTKEVDEEWNECVKTCKPGCTVWNYYLGYVQRTKLGSFKHSIFKDTFVVEIHFPTAHDVLSTTEIENQSLEKFVGNIGGLLGVWTGASILSILQCIFLCCCREFQWCTDNETVNTNETKLNDVKSKQ